jgi:hypothetical protein
MLPLLCAQPRPAISRLVVEILTSSTFAPGEGCSNARKDVVRVHLDAYKAFARRILSGGYGIGHLMRDMPEVTEAAIFEDDILAPEQALDVYKTFASEILHVFK